MLGDKDSVGSYGASHGNTDTSSVEEALGMVCSVSKGVGVQPR